MNATAPRLNHQRRWPLVVAGVLLALVIGVAIGEWLAWPFLAAPLERILSEKLDRRVRFSASTDSKLSAPKVSSLNKSRTNEAPISVFGVRFIGGLRLHSAQLEIAAPTWSSAPYLLLARDVTLELRYIDLWRAYHAQPLRIQRLQATALDSHLERLADGRASWQFGTKPAPAGQLMALPSFGSLQVTKGELHYSDVPLDTDINANFSFINNERKLATQANATGYYRKLPLKIELTSSGTLPEIADKVQLNKTLTVPVTLIFNAKVGRATLAFKGGTADVLHMTNFVGRFDLKGPSLGAVGDLLGVTLPTTAEFTAGGVINKHGSTWRVQVNTLDLGASHLNGTFVYEAGRSVPLLSGQLGGARLLLTDLGPAFGTVPSTTKRSKVLPDRPFDLAALRAMDADVLIDIQYADLNTSFLAPLRPLRGHLQLKDGVLTLQDLDARTAQGTLKGDLSLDGRGAKALWDAKLRWDGVRLERWIHQIRKDDLPPYISGRLNGRATLTGQGRSTAEILASLKGNVRSELRDGAISHLAIEVAGLDLAQAMGVMFKGDDALPVQCAVADLVAEGGVLRPRVMVLDTEDSVVWVDGSISMATEALNLRVVVMPKDFSPLTLRSPLRVRGSFAKPAVSLEKRPIGIKLATSFFLAILNPLAALIPLLDSGDVKEAQHRATGCQDLMQRGAAKPKAMR